MMRALEIIADSWPIAVMVVGVCAAYVVRRSIKQVVDTNHVEAMDRQSGSRAVVVQGRHSDD